MLMQTAAHGVPISCYPMVSGRQVVVVNGPCEIRTQTKGFAPKHGRPL